MAGRIAHLPVWTFHDTDDPIVPLNESQRMGTPSRRWGQVRFTIYPQAGHDV